MGEQTILTSPTTCRQHREHQGPRQGPLLHPYHLHRGTVSFKNAAAFNDDFAQERSGGCQDGFYPSILGVDPHRYDLPDTVRVGFTHGNLQRSNVIASVDRAYRVVAVVDWVEVGWMLEYWEVCRRTMGLFSPISGARCTCRGCWTWRVSMSRSGMLGTGSSGGFTLAEPGIGAEVCFLP